jgi:hypothetical protein
MQIHHKNRGHGSLRGETWEAEWEWEESWELVTDEPDAPAPPAAEEPEETFAGAVLREGSDFRRQTELQEKLAEREAGAASSRPGREGKVASRARADARESEVGSGGAEGEVASRESRVAGREPDAAAPLSSPPAAGGDSARSAQGWASPEPAGGGPAASRQPRAARASRPRSPRPGKKTEPLGPRASERAAPEGGEGSRERAGRTARSASPPRPLSLDRADADSGEGEPEESRPVARPAPVRETGAAEAASEEREERRRRVEWAR